MANKLKRSELHSYNCDRCEWTGSISGLIRLDSAHCPGCGYDGTLERQSNTNRINRAADVLRKAENKVDKPCKECSGNGIIEEDFPCGECWGEGREITPMRDYRKSTREALAILEGRE